jgi:hypothetical protein
MAPCFFSQALSLNSHCRELCHAMGVSMAIPTFHREILEITVGSGICSLFHGGVQWKVFLAEFGSPRNSLDATMQIYPGKRWKSTESPRPSPMTNASLASTCRPKVLPLQAFASPATRLQIL